MKHKSAKNLNKDQEEIKIDSQSKTTVDKGETPEQKLQRIERLKNNYAAFFEYYFPRFATYKCARFHKKLAAAVFNNKTFKGIVEAYRGSAKSTHANLGIPMWLKARGELKCMLLVGQTEVKAHRLLSALQVQLSTNQRYINDFGEQYTYGSWAQGEFVTQDNCAFYAIGFKQDPRGTRNDENRPDFIIVDDCDSKRLSKNPRLVKEAIEWITEDLMGCFDIGKERFLLLNNRVSNSGILARMHRYMVTEKKPSEKWWHLQVNAIDDKGRSTWPEKYSTLYWKRKRAEQTYRAWQSEYMNNPIEDGTVFSEQWIKWTEILPLYQYDRLVVYVDPSFKDTVHSDFKAVKFWGRKGHEFHLIDAWVRQTSINAMVRYLYDLHESIPGNVAVSFYMEANFLHDLIFDAFADEGDVRGYQLPIMGDKRHKPDKFSRIEATSALYERGFIFYNAAKQSDPDFATAREQLLAFERGSNAPDDSPDADEGALHLLNVNMRAANTKAIIGERRNRSSW